ncbi:hypothetical protein MVES1_001999 [Malassezia vespertilionis]|uniref:uncharacterized protein n=1 Tax=Malassezia vespertilionis TaxID=2020962 RepID=UPI0024B06538|nr:uncharacterized protein MVES1_001999 [Malassezia vespertilionis]WFD06645.1 hypothetical protein MVES1_001999 [Malassezia vespertilionis]
MVGVRALSSKPIFSQEPILRDRKGQPEGDFIRPQIEGDHLVATKETPIAEPKTPPSVKDYGVQQAPNYAQTWSPSQRPKSMAMRGPRFEQTNMPLQPASLSAMELINNEPIRMVMVHLATRVYT